MENSEKAVIFDFWGTLAESGVYPSALKQVKYILWVEGPFSYFAQAFEKAFMLRKFSNLNEAFETACTELELTYTPEQVEKLIGMWNKNKLLAKLFPETEEVLKSLKEKGYKLVLVSNTDFSQEGVIEKFNLKQYFDEILLSCDTGMLKSDPRMFELALSKVNVSKENALMVGDSIESDIKSAQRAGIKGLLVDRHERMQWSPKVRTLLDLEEFISTNL